MENQVAKVVVQLQPELLVRPRKLPELIVPIFTGKFADCPSFRKVFGLKHDDSGTTDNVSGELKLLIQNLSADDCNYKLAFATLDSKYDRKDQVLSELYTALDQFPPRFGYSRLENRSLSTRRIAHGIKGSW